MEIDKPIRRTYSYVQRLTGVATEIFPLLCPVNEEKWLPEWKPAVVYSDCGKIEKHCIFVTDDGHLSSVWVVSRYDPKRFELEFFKVTPDHSVVRIEIALKADGSCTNAAITYNYTAIASDGAEFLAGFTEEHFRQFMQRWERALNHYLVHGCKLED